MTSTFLGYLTACCLGFCLRGIVDKRVNLWEKWLAVFLTLVVLAVRSYFEG